MYNYEEMKPKIMTDSGRVMLLTMFQTSEKLIKASGAVTMGKLMSRLTGDTWEMMACADRLVEMNMLAEVPNTRSHAGQHRIFVKPGMEA